MTARATRIPLLVLVTLSASAGAPALLAQRPEASARRAVRAESGDSTVRQLRRLQIRADSLARLYNEATELSERRRVGGELDATVDEIEPLLRRLASIESRSTIELRMQTTPMAQMMVRTARAMPRGWVGIELLGAAREPRFENGEMIVRYLTHPEIVSVEPNSPAERAGLVPSDTLIAYDGRDVRTDISLTRLLRPNSRVLVRIRRDGRTRDVPLTVANVPSRITVRREARVAAGFAPGAGEMLVSPGMPRVPQPAAMPYTVRVPAPRAAPGASSMTAVPPVPPGPPMTIVFNPNGVAGAELSPVTEAWARVLGVKQGVVVTRAPASSLAALSGVQDGDVIVRVSGQPVMTVGQVRDLVEAASDAGTRSVDLDVVREKRPIRLALRW